MATTTRRRAEPEPAPPPAAQEPTRPAHEIRLGRCKGVIWANHGENGPIYSTQLFRLYRPEGPDSTWQQSNSFSAQELLIVAEVAAVLRVDLRADADDARSRLVKVSKGDTDVSRILGWCIAVAPV